jgi:hypothetical protein
VKAGWRLDRTLIRPAHRDHGVTASARSSHRTWGMSAFPRRNRISRLPGSPIASPKECRTGRVWESFLVRALRSGWRRVVFRCDRSSGEPALRRTCLMGKVWPQTQHPKRSTRNAAPETNRR